jgi:hypothetical protein
MTTQYRLYFNVIRKEFILIYHIQEDSNLRNDYFNLYYEIDIFTLERTAISDYRYEYVTSRNDLIKTFKSITEVKDYMLHNHFDYLL